MVSASSRFYCALLISSLLIAGAQAQKGGGGGTGGSRPSSIPRNTPPPPGNNNNFPDTTTSRPTFISGRVVLEGGGRLPEPVAIEKICNGTTAGSTTRREGYTDFKGEFQLQEGNDFGFQDASENDPRLMPGSPTPRQGGLQGMSARANCEYRAVLAGFQSTTVQVRDLGEEFQIELGTIVLKRLGDVKGLTVSATTAAAPKDAHHAYEKACKALQENKPEEEQKQLEKAVRLYPQFATAWSMLGDLEQTQKHPDEAKQAYTRATSADSQYVNPLFGLATIAVNEKNWADVAKFSAQAASLNAYAFPMVYWYNAVANFNLNQFEPAEASARKFKTMDTAHHHPEVNLLLGNVLLHRQDYAGAAQLINEYLALVPNAAHAEELKAQAKTLEEQSVAKKQ
jgi:tetratricopeptide (TPR) repeat protein